MSGLIEVYDASQRCYMPGYLRDIEKNRVLVQFGSPGSANASKPTWYDWACIREVPDPSSNSQPFAEDQQVEVQVGGEDQPTAWWEAKIVSKKGPFCKVHFLSPRNFPDEVVGEEEIRHASSSSVSKNTYSKQTIPLDEKLHQWFLENEERVMGDVRQKANLLAVSVGKRERHVKLIGSTKALQMGKMLLELHMKHQGDMTRIHSANEVLQKKLESKRLAREKGVRIQFPVPKNLIGLVVGKAGKNIKDVKQATKVDSIEVDQNGPSIIVTGPTEQSVEDAREMLEFVEEKMPVKTEQVGWLIGRGGKNFKELQEKTKVTRLNVDKNTNTVILVGNKTAVAAAQLYITTHLEYLAEYDKELSESEALRKELRQVALRDGDYAEAQKLAPPSGKGGGKGGLGLSKGGGGAGKGKDSGGRGGGRGDESARSGGGRGGGGRGGLIARHLLRGYARESKEGREYEGNGECHNMHVRKGEERVEIG